MLTENTISKLREIRLGTMAEAFREQLTNPEIVPSPKKQTKNAGKKPNEKNDEYNIKLLYPTAFIPRFA